MLPNRPADLPDLRLHLYREWQPDQLFDRVYRNVEYGPEFDRNALEHASLWWVSEDLATLVDHAAPSLPPTTLTPDLVPSEAGLVYFGTPLTGTDTAMDCEIRVDAILWGPATDPNGGEGYVSLSIYGLRDLGEPLLVPLGRTDWRFGMDSDQHAWKEVPPDERQDKSMAEDRRWIATVWLLKSQPLTETSTVPVPRASARRTQRAKLDPTVRLIDVRRPSSSSSSDTHREVQWSHRWIVGGDTGGFWRQQVCGPGRSERRPIWIMPFIKGPKDAPLKVKDTVHVMRQP